MEFGLLGTVVVRHGGREVVLGSGRMRAILAMLLLEPGRIVAVERLVDALWSDAKGPPPTARNSIQSCVSQLRSLFAVDPTLRLAHRRPGYLLEVEPDRVDLHHFRSLIAEARQEDDAGSAAGLLRRALALWRSGPLADVEAPGLVAVKHALAQQRLSALEDCVDLELGLGKHGELIPELTVLVAAHPLHERFHAQLMLALYRAGRAGDALRAFHDVREALNEELGTGPGHELLRVYDQVLHADPALSPVAPAAPLALTTPVAEPRRASRVLPRQLPPAPTGFTGRRHELAALTAALDAGDGEGVSVAISAIGGPGGVGKTWLALHWAHRHLDRFPDGQLFADLRGFDPAEDPMAPADALRGFLGALGVEPTGVPDELHARVGLYRSLVAGKRMLIVLDNARDAGHVTHLLPGVAGCTVLITSRNRMQGLATTYGSRNVALDVLSEAQAHDLLAERLGEQRLVREPDAATELIACCAGLPLALGILASRATRRPDFPLAALAAELRDTATRLSTLDTGEPTTSLGTVLSWSYSALAPDQARALGLLAAAPGPDIGLPAAAVLLGLPAAATGALLRALEGVCLVDEHAPARWRMHDLIRLHAAERACLDRPDDDRRAALHRVTDFYLHTAHAARELVLPRQEPVALGAPAPGCPPHPLPDRDAALEWLQTEHTNLLATPPVATELGRHDTAWRLTVILDRFTAWRGRLYDQLSLWQIGLDAAKRSGDPAARALAHRRLGLACAKDGRHAEALDHLHQALTWHERVDDPLGEAYTHRYLAWTWARQGDNERAVQHATRAHDLSRTVDHPVLEAHALNSLGLYTARLGHHDRARVHCEAALVLFRAHDHPDGEADTLDSLGFIAHHTGRHTEALGYYRQARALFHAVGNTYAEAGTSDWLGRAHTALGEHGQARRAWRRAVRLYEAKGYTGDAEAVQRSLDGLTAPPRTHVGHGARLAGSGRSGGRPAPRTSRTRLVDQ